MKKLSAKILSLTLAAIIAAGGAATASAENVRGDVNGDGSINSSDALMVLQKSVDLEVENFDEAAADVNGDGEINSSDALTILRISVGLEDPSTPEEPEKTPLDYNKQELVEYYNNALQTAYGAEKVTIDKKTNVSVHIDKLSVKSLMPLANQLIEQFAKPTAEKKTFNNGVAADGTKAKDFLVPYDLEADGAKEAVVTETENGYQVKITLVDEKVDYNKAPKYNTQASLPLPLLDNSMISSYGATITRAEYDYYGTVLTADIDKNGKILTLNHTMPLQLEAEGKYSIFTITGSGGGTYTLDASFTY